MAQDQLRAEPAQREDASPPDPQVKPTPNRWAKFGGQLKFYDEAFRLDPNSVEVIITRAYSNISIIESDPRADREGLLREANQLSMRAVALDGDNPRVWNARGWVRAWQQRWEESLTAYRKSLRIAPYVGGTIDDIAVVLPWSGRVEESLPLIDTALADERFGAPASLLRRKCGVYMYLGRYDEAVAACEKSAGIYTITLTYVYLTAAYAQRGDDAKAMATKKQLLKRWPDFTLARSRSLAPSDNAVYLQARETNVLGGLRKARVPEK